MKFIKLIGGVIIPINETGHVFVERNERPIYRSYIGLILSEVKVKLFLTRNSCRYYKEENKKISCENLTVWNVKIFIICFYVKVIDHIKPIPSLS